VIISMTRNLNFCHLLEAFTGIQLIFILLSIIKTKKKSGYIAFIMKVVYIKKKPQENILEAAYSYH
jgi:hypothetical protein